MKKPRTGVMLWMLRKSLAWGSKSSAGCFGLLLTMSSSPHASRTTTSRSATTTADPHTRAMSTRRRLIRGQYVREARWDCQSAGEAGWYPTHEPFAQFVPGLREQVTGAGEDLDLTGAGERLHHE